MNTQGKSGYPAVPGAKFWFSEGVTGFDFGAGDFQLGVTETRELAEFVVKACMGYEDLRRQRDELLAALKLARKVVVGDKVLNADGTRMDRYDLQNMLSEAIANAEKGTKPNE